MGQPGEQRTVGNHWQRLAQHSLQLRLQREKQRNGEPWPGLPVAQLHLVGWSWGTSGGGGQHLELSVQRQQERHVTVSLLSLLHTSSLVVFTTLPTNYSIRVLFLL